MCFSQYIRNVRGERKICLGFRLIEKLNNLMGKLELKVFESNENCHG